jgi:hypothetical protein
MRPTTCRFNQELLKKFTQQPAYFHHMELIGETKNMVLSKKFYSAASLPSSHGDQRNENLLILSGVVEEILPSSQPRLII